MDTGAEIYRRYLDGEEAAFDALLTCYRLKLIYFIDSIVHDPDTAEDIAIDVFLQLLIHPRRYNFKTSLKTYLFMLGRSRALDHLRRVRRILMEPLPENLAAEEALESLALRDARQQAVAKGLQQLPEDMRQALHLVYFEELSYEETADVMKTTRKQVDNLLYRGKKRLLGILGKEGAELL